VPAERVEGGYRLTGHKQFGSNGPAWTWLGAHAIDADAPGGPQIVHAFVERSSDGVAVWRRGTRSGCGPRRATTPSSTAVFVPDERIGRVDAGR
jgi:alkylation response protein AidB-like acyl-CoA dehydrogenase